MLSVIFMFFDLNDESLVNVDVVKEWCDDYLVFKKCVV